MCDKGEKGMSGPSSHTFFETNKGGWSEKYAELQRLCVPILDFCTRLLQQPVGTV